MRTSFDGFTESSMKSSPIMSGDEDITTNVSVCILYFTRIIILKNYFINFLFNAVPQIEHSFPF